jgi:hypothetical protein
VFSTMPDVNRLRDRPARTTSRCARPSCAAGG